MQLEKDLIATRLRNGRQFKSLERGIKASGNAPFGYRYEGHGSKCRKLVINPAEAETVRRMFKAFLRADSVRDTAEILTQEGCLNRRGKPFTRHTARAILLNSFYTGKVGYNGQTVRGQQERLISRVIFGKVMAKLARFRRN